MNERKRETKSKQKQESKLKSPKIQPILEIDDNETFEAPVFYMDLETELIIKPKGQTVFDFQEEFNKFLEEQLRISESKIPRIIFYSDLKKEVIYVYDPDVLHKALKEYWNKSNPIVVYTPKQESDNFYKKYKELLKRDESRNFENQITELLRGVVVDEKIEDLIIRLEANKNWLGGKKNCYKNEAKTRTFIDKVLDQACRENNNKIYSDLEVELTIFSVTLKPDYLVMRQNENSQVEVSHDTPLYVIEVKRTTGGQSNLLSHLDQHLKQLRLVCIHYGLSFVHGVITDYKEWYFTRFNLTLEIEEKLSEQSQELFEVSKRFQVLKQDDLNEDLVIDRRGLAMVVKILQTLYSISNKDDLRHQLIKCKQK